MLKKIPTLELALELAKRSDLSAVVRPDGLIDPQIWNLRRMIGPIACVDGLAVKRTDSGLLGGVIRRGTGQFAGKLAFVGGVVGLYESVESALKRHWKTDIGLDISIPLGWDHPILLRQYAPKVQGQNRCDFCEESHKHSIGLLHLVTVSGAVSFGAGIVGKEATELIWLSSDKCPPLSEWGYDMRETFLVAMQIAKDLLATGRLKLE